MSLEPLTLVFLSRSEWTSFGSARSRMIFEHLLSETPYFSSGIFVEPPMTASSQPWRKWFKPRQVFNPLSFVGGKQIMLLQPYFPLPFAYRRAIRSFVARNIARQIQTHAGRRFLLLTSVTDILSLEIANFLARSAVRTVLDVFDDYTTYGATDLAGIRRRMNDALQLAERVIYVNQHTAEKFPHPEQMVFQNCSDPDNFKVVDSNYVKLPYWPKPNGAKYVGFIGGVIDERINRELLKRLFTELPAFRFLFIGYVNNQELLEFIRSFPNADFVPGVSYRELSSIVGSFDCAIVPHLANEFTKGNDLLKVMDYLAAGVPVVSTISSNIENLRDVVSVAQSDEEFVQFVQSAVEHREQHNPTPGRKVAEQRSWKVQVPCLGTWMLEGLHLEV